MTELNYQELAKQGNPQAIASLLDSQLQSEGITTAVNLNGDCLDVILDAEQIPTQDRLVEVVRSKLTDLQTDSIRKVKIEAREKGEIAVSWSREFSLDSSILDFPKNGEEVVSNTINNNSNFRYNASDSDEKQSELVGFENRLRATLIVVGIVTGILAIAVVVFVNKTLNESVASAEKNIEETANLATTQEDTFRVAVNSAVKAAELGRSAKTKEDWNSVADRWQEAVSLMRRVPPSSPHHQVAQTKVVEYQKYLLYAQESAVTLPLPTPTTAEKATPEKATYQKLNSEKATSEKSKSDNSTPKKSTSEKVNPEKASPSR
jgi:hypothetical protein